MGVLWWLAVPLGITALAMVWAAWVGRPRDDRGRDEAARARLAEALAKPTPAGARRVAVQPADPPRGVAVRPSARTKPRTKTRAEQRTEAATNPRRTAG